MIHAVFFDAGGVLVSIADFEDDYAAEALKVNRREFDKIAAKYSDACESAKISDNEFLKKFCRAFNLDSKFVKSVWLKEYWKILKLNKAVYRIAFSLKRRGYRIGVLSNTKKMYTNLNKKKNVYFGFSPVVLSYKVKLVKPGKKIYAAACRLAKVKPSEALFIDDRIANVKGAQKFGMRAIHYKNPSQLKIELRKLNIKF